VTKACGNGGVLDAEEDPQIELPAHFWRVDRQRGRRILQDQRRRRSGQPEAAEILGHQTEPGERRGRQVDLTAGVPPFKPRDLTSGEGRDDATFRARPRERRAVRQLVELGPGDGSVGRHRDAALAAEIYQPCRFSHRDRAGAEVDLYGPTRGVPEHHPLTLKNRPPIILS
jgi:hypothetical protein